MECIELNRLCKHKEKVTNSQNSISINSCTELSKHYSEAVVQRCSVKKVFL